ncbi:HAD family hydrolase [Nakamurella sp.]|uniref:HAD family hydrolase n=1 Tax=Nakamurella sp. TaxID=1869182 RepID=UPI003783D501
MSSLQAVLFDLDGTVVDSEPLWADAMRVIATDLGGTLTEEVLARTTGLSVPASVDLMLAELGSDLPHHEATRQLLDRAAEVFATELMWQPGAQELIDALRAEGVTTALVTSSPRVVVDVAMQRLGSHRFDLAVCGDEVSSPKPDPEPYLTAMQRLGLPATDCLAVEDSPSGTEAAVAADIPVLVVPSEVAVPEGPGRIFAASLLEATVDELRHLHSAFHRAGRGA